MVKSRVIPSLLLKNGRLIKTKQFGEYRDVGNPRTIAKIYDAQRADELIFLDITASIEKRHFLIDILTSVAEECFMPLCAGGGIRNFDQAREVLKSGADKIAINTKAIENPNFITEISKKFGKSTIVVSIDYKKNSSGKNEVFIDRGTKSTGLDPIEWSKEVEKMEAGEILLTCIDKEGTMNGYDLEIIQKVSDSVSIPVIASGGVGTIQDIVDGIFIGHASAVSMGSILHFTDQNIFKIHSHMHEKGLLVRR